MQLQPLLARNLATAQRIALDLFPWEQEHQVALAAAAEPMGHSSFLIEHKLESVRAWTAHEPGGAIRGIASLYSYVAQPEETWLAWFGLVPEARGRRAGSRMLDWVIAQTQREGRRTMRLWTTDEDEYAAAIQLYLRRGFVPEDYPALPGEDWRTIVFSLGLDGSQPTPWSGMLDRGELCGRQLVPAACLAA